MVNHPLGITTQSEITMEILNEQTKERFSPKLLELFKSLYPNGYDKVYFSYNRTYQYLAVIVEKVPNIIYIDSFKKDPKIKDVSYLASSPRDLLLFKNISSTRADDVIDNELWALQEIIMLHLMTETTTKFIDEYLLQISEDVGINQYSIIYNCLNSKIAQIDPVEIELSSSDLQLPHSHRISKQGSVLMLEFVYTTEDGKEVVRQLGNISHLFDNDSPQKDTDECEDNLLKNINTANQYLEEISNEIKNGRILSDQDVNLLNSLIELVEKLKVSFIIKSYYQGYLQKDIANWFGLSAARISQIIEENKKNNS